MTVSPNDNEDDCQGGPQLSEVPRSETAAESCPQEFFDSAVLLGGEAETPLPPSPRLAPQRVAELAEQVFGQGTAPIGTLPTIPGYEVLEALGRGGMGIVYKAHQINLNRLVALKMLPGGIAGDPSELARFRTEVEAVARLQHPNIVQIFEVGEHAGQPYCVLELVAGGSLARKLAGTPQPMREAAGCVEILARAVQHAHERGILHRDLKPSNVLLSPDGMPRIADFGLAKCFAAETLAGADPTRSNLLLGTPGYMAPEQADGRHQDLSPATDVYALGAIVYELVTGRVPFRGETVMETLWQTQFQEPLPPSRMRARLPRDLETICLKCLEKEPSKRYATAEALADDLRRFLAGEPIQARRASLGGKALRWAKRRPAAAALICLSALTVMGALVAVSLHNRELAQSAARERELARQAQSERQRALLAAHNARRATDQMMDVMENHLAVTTRRDPMRRDVLKAGLAIYQGFLSDQDPALEMQLERVRALRRISSILAELDQREQAEKSLNESLALAQRLQAEFPDEPEVLHAMAMTQNARAGFFTRLKRTPEAVDASEQALALGRKLVENHPDSLVYRDRLAGFLNTRGLRLTRSGQSGEAERLHREAKELCEANVTAMPDNADYQSTLGLTLNNLAMLLYVKNDRSAQTEARRHLEQAIVHQQRALDLPGRRPTYRVFIRNSHGALTESLLRLGEHAEAARVVVQLPTFFPDDWLDYKRAADFLQRCRQLAEQDTAMAPPDRQKKSQIYGAQAESFRQEALKRGYKPEKKPSAQVNSRR